MAKMHKTLGQDRNPARLYSKLNMRHFKSN